jgi:AcrR family transcriptional regulator
MVKTWSDDNPKAALMSRKRTMIVDAALRAFLENGYAESSVNRIAEEAGVSIKTLYRHFESKGRSVQCSDARSLLDAGYSTDIHNGSKRGRRAELVSRTPAGRATNRRGRVS